jgi:hypothetical protein
VESEKPGRPIPFIKAAPNWRIGPAMFTAFAGLAAPGTMEEDGSRQERLRSHDMMKGEEDVVSGLNHKLQSAAANVMPAGILLGSRPPSLGSRSHVVERCGARIIASQRTQGRADLPAF